MFEPVSSRVSFPELEAKVLQSWKDKDVFHRTETERQDSPLFMLFEGPPTANGSPGIHHVLARVFKDVICRHRTMKGFRCLRKGGWDTHGLPVELEVEKELGFSTKREIEEYDDTYVRRRPTDQLRACRVSRCADSSAPRGRRAMNATNRRPGSAQRRPGESLR